MCGFAGFINPSPNRTVDELLAIAKAMNDRIAWRGPDDSAEWASAKAGVGIGHRRLSIIDLSALGRQPMVSACDRYVIVYNGEVYNFRDLQQTLLKRGVNFKSQTDTEVILEAFSHLGIKETLSKMVGMFSLAIWDQNESRLILARDRLGIKPLYWGKVKDVVYFGSQPRAFSAHPEWRSELNREAVTSYFRHLYVPEPQTIYKDIQKLKPGSLVEIHQTGEIKHDVFWDGRKIAAGKCVNLSAISDCEGIDALEHVLGEAVGCRMIADVPLGAFLSGGIDSSTVVALMQAKSSEPIKTFSIGSYNEGFDEAEHAKKVARHLGTDHTELYLNGRDIIDILPNLSDWFDEPFADSSQLPTYLVSRLARQSVTVALSGDGGDELFAGYNRYVWDHGNLKHLLALPRSIRLMIANGLENVTPKTLQLLQNLIPRSYRYPYMSDKLIKLANLLRVKDTSEIYWTLVSCWQHPENLVLDASEPTSVLDNLSLFEEAGSSTQYMQMMDLIGYLPGDILTKLDRASMAVSLEARVPILDHRVVEFAFGLPGHFKVRDGQSKWVLRQLLSKYVPNELVERPKMGFSIPLGDWLRQDLRDWTETLLDPVELRQDGILNADLIRRIWSEHLQGTADHQQKLWSVIAFQMWKKAYI